MQAKLDIYPPLISINPFAYFGKVGKHVVFEYSYFLGISIFVRVVPFKPPTGLFLTFPNYHRFSVIFFNILINLHFWGFWKNLLRSGSSHQNLVLLSLWIGSLIEFAYSLIATNNLKKIKFSIVMLISLFSMFRGKMEGKVQSPERLFLEQSQNFQ